jgi:CheY-like chemotaxis protein
MASAGGTHGARNPAQGGIGWHCPAAAGTITVRVIAGERPIHPGNEKRPQQDSNLRSRLRRPLLSPLSYGGYAPGKGYQPKSPPPTRSRTGCDHPPEDATLLRVTQVLGRVLVVDDDEVIRRLIAVNLQLEGFDVEMAVDGQDCLDRVTEVAPDVITLDVMMPRLDGWETAVQLRKSPETAHIKVVLITARAQEDDKTRGTHVGADAYLTKPFDPNEMIRVIRELAGVV